MRPVPHHYLQHSPHTAHWLVDNTREWWRTQPADGIFWCIFLSNNTIFLSM